jgi:hypothetical protein
MRAAALPARTLEHATDRGFQAFVSIAGNQLHTAESARTEAAQKRVPEGAIFTRPNIQPDLHVRKRSTSLSSVWHSRLT